VPSLDLDADMYARVSSISRRPTAMRERSWQTGPVSGVRSHGPRSAIGKATSGHGPVAVAWNSALAQSRNARSARNVIVHELAHKIDSADGSGDGIPPIVGALRERWLVALDDEFHRDEERPSDQVLGNYAWTNPKEFFAVSTERFFCVPTRLREAKPELYGALTELYRQDPAAVADAA